MAKTKNSDVLNEYLLKAISDPDRFEFGDETMDNVEPSARASFAKRVNGIMATIGLPERVRLIKEIEGNDAERKAEQKKDFLCTLNRLFEKVRDEPEIARTLIPRDWIDNEQESLIEKYRAMSEEYYGVAQPLNINQDTVIAWSKTNTEFLESETMLDDLVKYGSTLIKDFEDVWRVAFLAQASCYAPGIVQGEKEHRGQIHILIAGEYSTSKSGLVGYMTKMFPRVVRCSDVTSVGLMGSIKKDGTEITGLAQEADRSILTLDEFDKLVKRNGGIDGILRAIMEDQYFKRKTAFGTIEYETRPSVMAFANPKRDVFYSDEMLATQVPFKVGLLSRFDYIRPLAYSKEKINGIAGFIAHTAFKVVTDKSAMGTRDVLQTFYALQASMKENQVRQVASDESLRVDIHERFVALQREIDGVPLLSVRDFMSALRIFNASTILHHRQRNIVDGIVSAEEQDRDQAIYVLDNTVKSRETLLLSSRRQDVCASPVERAHGQLMAMIQRSNGAISKQDAVSHLMSSMGIGQSTAYKFLGIITERDREIRQDGLRGAMLVLAH